MKKIYSMILSMFAASMLLVGCGHDDEGEGDFNPYSLGETKWKGQLLTSEANGEEEVASPTEILFLSDKTGRFRAEKVYFGNDYSGAFAYDRADRLLSISKEDPKEIDGPLLAGKWVITKFNSDSLVMYDSSWFGSGFARQLKLKRVNKKFD